MNRYIWILMILAACSSPASAPVGLIPDTAILGTWYLTETRYPADTIVYIHPARYDISASEIQISKWGNNAYAPARIHPYQIVGDSIRVGHLNTGYYIYLGIDNLELRTRDMGQEFSLYLTP